LMLVLSSSMMCSRRLTNSLADSMFMILFIGLEVGQPSQSEQHIVLLA